MPYYYRSRRTYNHFVCTCADCGRKLYRYEGVLQYKRADGSWRVTCRYGCASRPSFVEEAPPLAQAPALLPEPKRPTVVGPCDVVEPDGTVTMGYMLTDGSIMKPRR